jgi:hypothetical protein
MPKMVPCALVDIAHHRRLHSNVGNGRSYVLRMEHRTHCFARAKPDSNGALGVAENSPD